LAATPSWPIAWKTNWHGVGRLQLHPVIAGNTFARTKGHRHEHGQDNIIAGNTFAGDDR
jgi:hypothetical protein